MYRHDNAGTNPGTSFGAELTFWQGGVVQHIDAAAMDLYAIYQQTDGDAFFIPDAAFPGETSLDTFKMVTVGAMIQF